MTIAAAVLFATGVPVPGTARAYPIDDLNTLAAKVSVQCAKFGHAGVRVEVDTLRRRVNVFNCVLNLDLLTAHDRDMLGSKASYGPVAIS